MIDGTAFDQVQRCTLLNIKTGGCPEDCHYCSQSAKYREKTGTKAERLMDIDAVYEVMHRQNYDLHVVKV